MVANGKYDHHETFLWYLTPTYYNKQMKVKLPIMLLIKSSQENLGEWYTQTTDLKFGSIHLNLHGLQRE